MKPRHIGAVVLVGVFLSSRVVANKAWRVEP